MNYEHKITNFAFPYMLLENLLYISYIHIICYTYTYVIHIIGKFANNKCTDFNQIL